jgi:hypothetical protein
MSDPTVINVKVQRYSPDAGAPMIRRFRRH